MTGNGAYNDSTTSTIVEVGNHEEVMDLVEACWTY